jgi:hypothetical protein
MLILWALGPIILVIVLHSVVYFGWRHLYFIYPSLLLLAVRGVVAIIATVQTLSVLRPAAIALGAVAIIGVIHTGVRMIREHPFQEVYFSILSADMAERLFDRDYWGLSSRHGLEWVLAHDSAPVINVTATHPSLLYHNSLILPPKARARLRYIPQARHSEADYYFTHYLLHPQTYGDSLGKEVYMIRSGGVRILSVFKTPK